MLALRESLWRLECALNVQGPLSALDARVVEFAPVAGTAVLKGEGEPPACELCIVLSTYDRVAPCGRLVEQLAVASRDAGLDPFIVVFEDRSAADYAPVLALLERHFAGRYAFYRPVERVGKQGYWQVYARAFEVVSRLGPALTLFLQDDLTLKPRFFTEMLELWHALSEPDKAVLYLCAMPGDQAGGRWIRYARQSRLGGRVWRTQWFDLQAFLAGPRFFETLRGRVFPVPKARWRRDPTRSSGVGEQFSRRLLKRAGIYQVKETLVFHGGELSLMNPEVRQRVPFDNRTPVEEAVDRS